VPPKAGAVPAARPSRSASASRCISDEADAPAIVTKRVMVEIARLLPREYRGVYAEEADAATTPTPTSPASAESDLPPSGSRRQRR
jgi:hypothetical protein